MRKPLVDHLQCPVSGESLVLEASQTDEQELRWGVLTTLSGNHAYNIIDGVAELLPPLDPATQLERTARENLPYDQVFEHPDDYAQELLAAPYPERSVNAEQGLAQVELNNRFVLDVGASTGWTTRMLCERGAHAVALDLSTQSLRFAQAQFKLGVYFERVAATMTALPFKNTTFDVVFTSASVHHASDLRKAIQEFSRVLKHGGYAIFASEPVLGRLHPRIKFGLEDLSLGMNEHIYRIQDYQRIAQASGLQTKLIFPADLAKQLERTLPAPTKLIHWASFVWRWLPSPLRPVSFIFARWFGVFSLMMVAKKVTNSAPAPFH